MGVAALVIALTVNALTPTPHQLRSRVRRQAGIEQTIACASPATEHLWCQASDGQQLSPAFKDLWGVDHIPSLSATSMSDPSRVLVTVYDICEPLTWLFSLAAGKALPMIPHVGVHCFGQEHCFSIWGVLSSSACNPQRMGECDVTASEEARAKRLADAWHGVRPMEVMEGLMGSTSQVTLDLGPSVLSEAEIAELIARYRHEWTPDSYDIFDRNCNHFGYLLASRLAQPSNVPHPLLAPVIGVSDNFLDALPAWRRRVGTHAMRGIVQAACTLLRSLDRLLPDALLPDAEAIANTATATATTAGASDPSAAAALVANGWPWALRGGGGAIRMGVQVESGRAAGGVELPAQLGLTFSPGGFLFPYYVGVAYELQRLGHLTASTPLGGSSAGAIVSASVACGLSEADVRQCLSRFLGAARAGAPLNLALREQLGRILPDDAPQKAREHGLTLAYLEVWPRPLTRHLVTSWASKQDLIDVIVASSNWPLFTSRWPFTKCRGAWAIDGFFAVATSRFGCPPIDAERVVGCTCLPSVQLDDFCEEDLIQPGTCGFELPSGQMATARWWGWSVVPATDEEIDQLIEVGRAHAALWVSRQVQ